MVFFSLQFVLIGVENAIGVRKPVPCFILMNTRKRNFALLLAAGMMMFAGTVLREGYFIFWRIEFYQRMDAYLVVFLTDRST